MERCLRSMTQSHLAMADWTAVDTCPKPGQLRSLSQVLKLGPETVVQKCWWLQQRWCRDAAGESDTAELQSYGYNVLAERHNTGTQARQSERYNNGGPLVAISCLQ